SIGFVGDDALGSGSANTLFAGTVLTDSLYRFPLSEDGMGLALDGALKDKVDDNAAKGDLGESRDFVVGTGFGIVTHVEQGPDGALYVLSLSNGSIYQVTASTAEASANATPSGAVAAAATPGGAAAQPGATPGLAAGSATQVTVGTDTGTQNLFIPDAITVKESQPVVLTYQNLSTQPHNLTFPPPLDVKTKVIVPPGGSETLKFVAPSAGSYQFVCTIHPGMVGTMTSEP
ncbi:MAG TPA: cupredoxin domain-containing protein, partial [Nonomuraea sp.]|nr:cupredoxin domain-containing protein [Nonomuraea sp.]